TSPPAPRLKRGACPSRATTSTGARLAAMMGWKSLSRRRAYCSIEVMPASAFPAQPDDGTPIRALLPLAICDIIGVILIDRASGPSDRVPSGRRRTTAIASGRAVFTPSIASEILNLHPRTLMIYESENRIKPQRTATTRRRYSEDDIRRVRVIQFLTRQKGVNLAGVKYVLRLLESLGEQGLSPSEVQELDTLDEVAGPSLSA